ncbi:hypothetical protein [Anthocerotibacter panamensis]|uniref:hypothetical protein n=1 Tax=Anthocerotibacter panamensis TaxID=2857077 RepID=UPI001C404E0A|nr:hypothetical protein [Anthocerotibacter panamensis]
MRKLFTWCLCSTIVALIDGGSSVSAVTLRLDGATNFISSGVAAGPAQVGSIVNTTGGNGGFDNFFTSDFGLLGTSNGLTTLTGVNSGVSTLTSQPFTLAGSNLLEPVTISFDFAFDGNDLGVLTDIFSVSLTNLTTNLSLPIFGVAAGLPVLSLPTLFRDTEPGLGLQGSVSTTLLDVNFLNLFDQYALSFQLQEFPELLLQGNTAAGLDNVVISTTPAAVPEPGMTTGLMALGFWGSFSQLYLARTRRKG